MFHRPARLLTVVLAVVMAAALTAPAALANHNNQLKKNGSINVAKIDGPHERIPNPPAPNELPKAECVFTGTVAQQKGVDPLNPLNPVHDHVTLASLTLDCRDLETPGGTSTRCSR